ncbi:ferric uptake regulation domain protein, partial [Vibrio harveyi]
SSRLYPTRTYHCDRHSRHPSCCCSSPFFKPPRRCVSSKNGIHR